MPLPKIDVITSTVVVPSTKREISIRPFFVKEQKILLTAIAGNDALEISSAVKQVVNNCVMTDNFDVEKLEVFDLEYIMLQLRIISVGETTKISFYGIEDSKCEECKKQKDVELKLKDIQVTVNEVNNKIYLTDSVGIMMRYPSHKALALFTKNREQPNSDLKLLWSCVESVYDENSVMSSKDFTVDEGIQFLESLTTKQFSQIEEFLHSMPHLSHTVELECAACGTKQSHVITGLESFLG